MTNIFRTLKSGTLTSILIGSLPFVSLSAQDHVQGQLPTGTVPVTVPGRGEHGEAVRQAVEARGHITGTGEDLALIYYQGSPVALGLRVSVGGPTAAQVLDAPLPGSFVAPSPLSPIGLRIQNILGASDGQVLAVTSDSASLGLYLTILSVHDRQLKSLTGGVPLHAHDFDLDCEPHAPCRVIGYGKWTDRASSWASVYQWSGSSYVETYDNEPYCLKRLAHLAEAASAPQPMTVFSRAALAREVAEEYLDRRDHAAAIRVCESVLARLQDPSASTARSQSVRVAGQPPDLQADQREEKAIVHELLAACLEKAGREADARAQLSLAQAERSRH